MAMEEEEGLICCNKEGGDEKKRREDEGTGQENWRRRGERKKIKKSETDQRPKSPSNKKH
jgi:hypothetical protein